MGRHLRRPVQKCLLGTRCYKHSVATRLKRFLKSSRFSRRIRFGWECRSHLGVYAAKPNLPDLGPRRLLFLKLTLMVRLGNRTYRTSILNFSFQVRRGSKPRLRGPGVQNWTKKPKTEWHCLRLAKNLTKRWVRDTIYVLNTVILLPMY